MVKLLAAFVLVGYTLGAMAKILEQVAILGSHQFLDRLTLAYHYAIAARLIAVPEEVLSVARDKLRRWTKIHAGSSTAYALEEWQHLLDTRTVPELIAIITEDSDEGQRLRQSTPFVGILPESEREELYTLCEKKAVA